jgi:tetratricopeptide (TPR) repeat protein
VPKQRLATAALVIVCLAGCGVGERAAPRLAKANELIAAGQLEEAEFELRKALEAEPKNAEVNYQLAKLLHREERIPDAVFFYEEALRLDPRHADAALTLAFLMLGDDVGYSERLVDGVIERDPKNALAWVRRSDIALARGDADAALAAALTAAELAPRSARTQIQAGLVHRARIRKHLLLKQPVPDSIYEQALAAFERASQGEDDSPDHQTLAMAWVERANTFSSWPARVGEAAAAYREAFEAAQRLGGGYDAALDGALAHARRTKDAELQRWALEKGVEVHPERLELWQRLAQATEQPGATSSPTLERLISVRARDARAHSTYARDLAARGRSKDALAHLDAVAPKLDAPAVARLAQVEIAAAAGDLDAAKAAAARLAKEHAGSLEDRIAKAEILARDRKYAAAADALDGAIDAYGGTAQLHLRLAELRLLAADAEAALEAAEAGLSVASSPLHKLALLRVQSRAQLARGAFDAAAVSFGRMREITQGKVASKDLVPYAQALYATGREGAARSLLETALTIEPPPIEAVVLYARREGVKETERAEKLVAAALEQHPQNPTLLEEAARFDLAAGRAKQAVQRLEAALESAPDYAPLHVTLARVRFQTGDTDGAIASAEQALRLDPSSPNPIAARVLVAAYAQAGKVEEAVARLGAAHKDGKLGIGSQVLLARLLAAQQKRDEAIAVLENVAKAAPNLAGPKNDLAYLLIASGRDLDRALSMAQEARAALPNLGPVADTLGFAYLAKQLPDAALPQFEEAVNLAEHGSPEWGIAQLHRAQALAELKRTDDARAAAEAALSAAKFPEQAEAQKLLDSLKAG